MKKKAAEDREHLEMKDSQVWRSWLETNHNSSPGVWLLIHKKDSPYTSITYDQAVDDAICYGWIDSFIRKYDDLRFKQYFSPRKPGSPWSRVNKNKIKKLEEYGLLREPGLQKIQQAKKDGSWTIYDEVEDDIIPPDLQAELDKHPQAKAYFLETLSVSRRKGILWWLKTAKTEITRNKRILKIIEASQESRPAL